MRAVPGTGIAGTATALLAAATLWLALPALAAEPLKIGVLKLASSGPVFLADAEGYFTEAGLATTLVYFDAAQPVAVATVSGDIDVGVTGLTAGFYNLAGKGVLRIIGAQSREEPGYHLIAYLAGNRAFDGGLKSLADLPGHSVAVTQIGSTFHYSLGLLAEKRGFSLDRLRIVPLQTMSAEAAALQGNQVDAALLPATVAEPVVAHGDAHLLGWVGDETPWQLGAVFAAKKTTATRRPALTAFLAAYRRGVRDYYDAFLAKAADGTRKVSDKTPAMLAILAQYTGQPAAQIANAVPFVDPDGKLNFHDIYHQVEWYKSQGLADKSIEASAIVDFSFIVYDK